MARQLPRVNPKQWSAARFRRHRTNIGGTVERERCPGPRWRDSWTTTISSTLGDDMAEPAAVVSWAERSEFVHRSWPARPRHLAALRAEVRRWLAPLALPGDAEIDLLLAVNEAASNSVEHAYTPATADDTVELTFWTEPRSVCVEIVDHGTWRTPCGQPTGRGRGIEIMQRLIPVILIHYDRRGTRVLLSHPLPGPVARIPAEPAEDATAAGPAGGVQLGRPASHR